jgi:hypothetical protein
LAGNFACAFWASPPLFRFGKNMNDMSPSTTPLPARILLGVFILWQLFFLFSSNLLSLLPRVREFWQDKSSAEAVAPDWLHEKGRVAEVERVLTGVTTRWAEISGQPQNWSLFAPNVTNVIPFVAVEFCWEEEPTSARSISRWLATLVPGQVFNEAILAAAACRKDPEMLDIERRLRGLLAAGDVQAPPPAGWRRQPHMAVVVLSANEPKHIRHYIKLGRFRLRRFESNIDVSLASADKNPDAVVDSWRENIEDRVRDHGQLMAAYLQWQLRRWSEKHPDLPEPKQVVLWVRLYRVPSAEEAPSPWSWQGPEWHPVARWRPGAEWTPEQLPVEMFNPVVERFESLRRHHESEHE